MAKLDKIRTHISENRKVYIAAGVGIAVGAGITAVILKKPDTQIAPKINQILSYKPNATLEVHIEALGDPGNIIQDLTTGTVYASQGQAARELGVNPARISENLAGKIPDVKGHAFKLLGKAPVTV